VDSYSKVKEDIELKETGSDIFSDYYWSTINGFKGVLHRWPEDLAMKLQTKMVARAVSDTHLANALNISPKTAKFIIDAYSTNEVIRYNRKELSSLDKMLLKRTASTLGFDCTYNLLKSDKTEIQMEGIYTKHMSMASDIANIAANQETFNKQQEFFKQQQESLMQQILELLKSPAAASSREGLVQNNASNPILAYPPMCNGVLSPKNSPQSRVLASQ